MGTKGIEVVGVNVDELIKMLNAAVADEWLAFYQYWVGAKVIKGVLAKPVIAELNEHAQDEYRHADMLANRIIELGGEPIIHPKKWFEETACGYAAPENADTKEILKQNISGERCAIDAYKKLMDFTKDKDPVTYMMALEIFKDEIEHEDDLQNILEDIEKGL